MRAFDVPSDSPILDESIEKNYPPLAAKIAVQKNS
jgi:hypothetical protein